MNKSYKLLSAPMAGFTNYAFRELLRIFGGVDVIETEMVSARSFVELELRSSEFPSRLWGVCGESLVTVQIWDNSPDTLSEFASRLACDFGVCGIDLNFGCPADRIAGKSASGSYLLRYPDRIGDIVKKVVVAAGKIPVTAKIRLGCTNDSINAVDVAQAIESAGASGVIVHGRTASAMYSGRADWDAIAAIKPKLKKIPLYGNGDIKTVEDAVERLENYPVDGIMIGRAAIAKPWIFKQIRAKIENRPIPPEPSFEELKNLIRLHYDLLRQQLNETHAIIQLRKHVCHYATGQKYSRQFRNSICSTNNENNFFNLINQYFSNKTNNINNPVINGNVR
ncbi:MAG: tRNA-dihydrouridine synthase [Planctomycetaceae bacterium]|jgi:tRNA-dihydrouridine synthase B|nr:tRNA-dihydrouridine synthase [Planctomycetaceae bacterium]